MNKYNKDGLLYLLNVMLFMVLFILEPDYYDYWVGGLILVLILTFLFLRPLSFSSANTLRTSLFEIENIIGITLSILFSFCMVVYFDLLALVDVVYVFVFSNVQAFSSFLPRDK